MPSVPPSISESSGIPKRKKLFPPRQFQLRPAVHRTTIYCRRGLALARLRWAYAAPGCHARLAMASGPKNRQGEAWIISLLEHDLFGKPASTFPDHARIPPVDSMTPQKPT